MRLCCDFLYMNGVMIMILLLLSKVEWHPVTASFLPLHHHMGSTTALETFILALR
jgi:hypothetical protein